MRLQLAAALEKENLDREKDAESPSSANSTILLGDLDELRTKIDRFQARRSIDHLPEVKADAQQLSLCFKDNQSSTLNCWDQVQKFKASSKRAQEVCRFGYAARDD